MTVILSIVAAWIASNLLFALAADTDSIRRRTVLFFLAVLVLVSCGVLVIASFVAGGGYSGANMVNR